MREGWRVGLLVALLFLAGCGASDRSGAETTTLTPVDPVEVTVTTTPEPPSIVPGMTRESVVDPAAVATTHERALRNASFWFTFNRTVVAANGTRLDHATLTGNVGPDAETYDLTLVRGAGATANRTTYRADANGSTGLPPVDPYFRGRLERLLGAFESTDVGRPPPNETEGIGTTYRIRASGFEDDAIRGENVRFRATVEPGGIIMSYRLRYETVRDGRRVVVRERLTHETVLFEPESDRG